MIYYASILHPDKYPFRFSFLRLLVGIHLSNVTKSNYLDIQKEAQFQRFARLSSHNTCYRHLYR